MAEVVKASMLVDVDANTKQIQQKLQHLRNLAQFQLKDKSSKQIVKNLDAVETKVKNLNLRANSLSMSEYLKELAKISKQYSKVEIAARKLSTVDLKTNGALDFKINTATKQLATFQKQLEKVKNTKINLKDLNPNAQPLLKGQVASGTKEDFLRGWDTKAQTATAAVAKLKGETDRLFQSLDKTSTLESKLTSSKGITGKIDQIKAKVDQQQAHAISGYQLKGKASTGTFSASKLLGYNPKSEGAPDFGESITGLLQKTKVAFDKTPITKSSIQQSTINAIAQQAIRQKSEADAKLDIARLNHERTDTIERRQLQGVTSTKPQVQALIDQALQSGKQKLTASDFSGAGDFKILQDKLLNGSAAKIKSLEKQSIDLGSWIDPSLVKNQLINAGINLDNVTASFNGIPAVEPKQFNKIVKQLQDNVQQAVQESGITIDLSSLLKIDASNTDTLKGQVDAAMQKILSDVQAQKTTTQKDYTAADKSFVAAQAESTKYTPEERTKLQTDLSRLESEKDQKIMNLQQQVQQLQNDLASLKDQRTQEESARANTLNQQVSQTGQAIDKKYTYAQNSQSVYDRRQQDKAEQQRKQREADAEKARQAAAEQAAREKQAAEEQAARERQAEQQAQRQRNDQHVSNAYTSEMLSSQSAYLQQQRAVNAEQARFNQTARADSGLNALQSRLTYMTSYAAMLRTVSSSIKQIISDIKQVDKAISGISVVTSMSTDQLWGQIGTYSALAQQYGVTTAGVYQVSQIFYQQGLQTSDAINMTTEALKMAKITGLEYADAADYLTTAVRGFKIEMEDASRVTDVWAALSANTAVSSNELAEAIGKTASSAESVGASFESTSAMIATMVATTRQSANNIGSALKSIIARYGELKSNPASVVDGEGDELSLNKVDTALQSVGISIHTASGQFRDFDDVIMELAQKWQTLDTLSQRYIATVMAGNRQQSRFIALVSNYDALKQNTNVAENSQDVGEYQALKAMDSIESKTTQLKSTFQEIYSSLGIENIIKDVIDFINKVVKKLSTLKPAAVFSFIMNIINTIRTGITSALDLARNGLKGFSDIKQTLKVGTDTTAAEDKIQKLRSDITDAQNIISHQKEFNLDTSAAMQRLQQLQVEAAKLTTAQIRLRAPELDNSGGFKKDVTDQQYSQYHNWAQAATVLKNNGQGDQVKNLNGYDQFQQVVGAFNNQYNTNLTSDQAINAMSQTGSLANLQTVWRSIAQAVDTATTSLNNLTQSTNAAATAQDQENQSNQQATTTPTSNAPTQQVPPTHTGDGPQKGTLQLQRAYDPQLAQQIQNAQSAAVAQGKRAKWSSRAGLLNFAGKSTQLKQARADLKSDTKDIDNTNIPDAIQTAGEKLAEAVKAGFVEAAQIEGQGQDESNAAYLARLTSTADTNFTNAANQNLATLRAGGTIIQAGSLTRKDGSQINTKVTAGNGEGNTFRQYDGTDPQNDVKETMFNSRTGNLETSRGIGGLASSAGDLNTAFQELKEYLKESGIELGTFKQQVQKGTILISQDGKELQVNAKELQVANSGLDKLHNSAQHASDAQNELSAAANKTKEALSKTLSDTWKRSITSMVSMVGSAINAWILKKQSEALAKQDSSTAETESSKTKAAGWGILSNVITGTMSGAAGGPRGMVAGAVVGLISGIAINLSTLLDGLDYTIEQRLANAEKELEESNKTKLEKKNQYQNYDSMVSSLKQLQENSYKSEQAMQAYKDKMAEVASQYPYLVSGYDEELNAIIDLQAAEEQLTRLRLASVNTAYTAAKGEQQALLLKLASVDDVIKGDGYLTSPSLTSASAIQQELMGIINGTNTIIDKGELSAIYLKTSGQYSDAITFFDDIIALVKAIDNPKNATAWEGAAVTQQGVKNALFGAQFGGGVPEFETQNYTPAILQSFQDLKDAADLLGADYATFFNDPNFNSDWVDFQAYVKAHETEEIEQLTTQRLGQLQKEYTNMILGWMQAARNSMTYFKGLSMQKIGFAASQQVNSLVTSKMLSTNKLNSIPDKVLNVFSSIISEAFDQKEYMDWVQQKRLAGVDPASLGVEAFIADKQLNLFRDQNFDNYAMYLSDLPSIYLDKAMALFTDMSSFECWSDVQKEYVKLFGQDMPAQLIKIMKAAYENSTADLKQSNLKRNTEMEQLFSENWTYGIYQKLSPEAAADYENQLAEAATKKKQGYITISQSIVEDVQNLWGYVGGLGGQAQRSVSSILGDADLTSFSGITKAMNQVRDLQREGKISEEQATDLTTFLTDFYDNVSFTVGSILDSYVTTLSEAQEDLDTLQAGYKGGLDIKNLQEIFNLLSRYTLTDSGKIFGIDAEGLKKLSYNDLFDYDAITGQMNLSAQGIMMSVAQGEKKIDQNLQLANKRLELRQKSIEQWTQNTTNTVDYSEGDIKITRNPSTGIYDWEGLYDAMGLEKDTFGEENTKMYQQMQVLLQEAYLAGNRTQESIMNYVKEQAQSIQIFKANQQLFADWSKQNYRKTTLSTILANFSFENIMSNGSGSKEAQKMLIDYYTALYSFDNKNLNVDEIANMAADSAQQAITQIRKGGRNAVEQMQSIYNQLGKNLSPQQLVTVYRGAVGDLIDSSDMILSGRNSIVTDAKVAEIIRKNGGAVQEVVDAAGNVVGYVVTKAITDNVDATKQYLNQIQYIATASELVTGVQQLFNAQNSGYDALMFALEAQSMSIEDAFKVVENNDYLTRQLAFYIRNNSLDTIGLERIGNKLQITDTKKWLGFASSQNAFQTINAADLSGIKAFKQYNESIIESETGFLDGLSEEVTALAQAKKGEKVDVSFMRKKFGDQKLTVLFRQLGIAYEDGIATMNSRLAYTVQGLTFLVQNMDFDTQSQRAELLDTIQKSEQQIYDAIGNGISGTLSNVQVQMLKRQGFKDSSFYSASNGQYGLKLKSMLDTMSFDSVPLRNLAKQGFAYQDILLESLKSFSSDIDTAMKGQLSHANYTNLIGQIGDQYEQYFKLGMDGYSMSLQGLGALMADKDLPETMRASISDAMTTAMSSVTSMLSQAIGGKLSIKSASNLAQLLDLNFESAFVRTAEGLQLTADAAGDIYSSLKQIDQLAASNFVTSVMQDLPGIANTVKTVSGTMSEINELTEAIGKNNQKTQKVYWTQERLGQRLSETEKNRIRNIFEINNELQNQLELYQQIALQQMSDPNAYKFADANLPNAQQGALNAWGSAATMMDNLTQASSNGYMAYEDFYAMVTFVGEQLGDAASQYFGECQTAADLIEKGAGALKNVDGKTVVDLKGLGLSLGQGAKGFKTGVSKSMQALAKGQIQMLDGMIALLETIVAAEEIGETIDTDMNGTIEIGEFQVAQSYPKKTQQSFDTLIAIANDNQTLKQLLTGVKIGTQNVYELLSGDWTELTGSQAQQFVDWLNQFYSVAGDMDWTEQPAEIARKLAQMFPQLQVLQQQTGKIVGAIINGMYTDLALPDYDKNETLQNWVSTWLQNATLDDKIGQVIQQYQADPSKMVNEDLVLYHTVYTGIIQLEESDDGTKYKILGKTYNSLQQAVKAASFVDNVEGATEVWRITEDTVYGTVQVSGAKLETVYNIATEETTYVFTDPNNPSLYGKGSTPQQAIKNCFDTNTGTLSNTYGITTADVYYLTVTKGVQIQYNYTPEEGSQEGNKTPAQAAKEVLGNWDTYSQTIQDAIDNGEEVIEINGFTYKINQGDTPQDVKESLLEYAGIDMSLVESIKTAIEGLDWDSIGTALSTAIQNAISGGSEGTEETEISTSALTFTPENINVQIDQNTQAQLNAAVKVDNLDLTASAVNVATTEDATGTVSSTISTDNIGISANGNIAIATTESAIATVSDVTTDNVNVKASNLTLGTDQNTNASISELSTGALVVSPETIWVRTLEGTTGILSSVLKIAAATLTPDSVNLSVPVGTVATGVASIAVANIIAKPQAIALDVASTLISQSSPTVTTESATVAPIVLGVDTQGSTIVPVPEFNASTAQVTITPDSTKLNLPTTVNAKGQVIATTNTKVTIPAALSPEIEALNKLIAQLQQTEIVIKVKFVNQGGVPNPNNGSSGPLTGERKYTLGTASGQVEPSKTPYKQNMFSNSSSGKGNNSGVSTSPTIDTSAFLTASALMQASIAASADSIGVLQIAIANLANTINGIDFTTAKDKATQFKNQIAAVATKLGKQITAKASITVSVKVNGPTKATGSIALNSGNFNKYGTGSLSMTRAFAAGTLMGELGPQLVVSGGRYFTVGNNGPEFVNLADDAIVFNHLQTASLLGSGKTRTHGKPVTNERNATSLATGNAMASASAALAALKELRAMWAKMASASASDLGRKAGSGGGGGGGGGDDKTGAYVGDLQRWYNLLKQIETTEQDINLLQAERSNMVHHQLGDGQKYVKSLQKELGLLQKQITNYQQLYDLARDYQQKRANDLENSMYGKILDIMQDGTVQYTDEGFKLLAELNKTKEDGVTAAYNAQQQLAIINKMGISSASLMTKSDGTKVDKKDYAGQVQVFWDNIDAWRSEMEQLQSSTNEYKKSLEDTVSAIHDINEELIDIQKSAEELVYTALTDKAQNAIDTLQEQLDDLQQANQKYINGLQENLDKQRQMYDSQANTEQLVKLQRQLAILQRTGGSASEIKSLQQQINSKMQDDYFEQQQDEIDKLQESVDKQVEMLQAQIDIQTEALEYQKENGLLWGQVSKILETQDLNYIGSFIADNTAALQSLSTLDINTQMNQHLIAIQKYLQILQQGGIEKMISDAEKQAEEANTEKQITLSNAEKSAQYQNYVAGNTENSVLKNVKSVESLYSDDYNETMAAKAQADELLAKLKQDYGTNDDTYNKLNSLVNGNKYNTNTYSIDQIISDLIQKQGGNDQTYQNLSAVLKNITTSTDKKGKSTGVTNSNLSKLANSKQASFNTSIASNAQKRDYQIATAFESEYSGNEADDAQLLTALNGLYTQTTDDKEFVPYDNKNFSKYQAYLNEKNKGIKGVKLGKGRYFHILAFAGQKSVQDVKAEYLDYKNVLRTGWFHLPDGYWDEHAEELAAIYAYYDNKLPQYLQGGLVDFTGPAWLDGTKQKPEAILNADEYAALKKLVSGSKLDILSNAINSISNASSAIASASEQQGAVIFDNISINITTGNIANDYDARRLGSQVFDQMMNMARRNSNISINRR